MDDGSTIKEFQENEQDFALQATVPTVVSEDERYLVRPPSPSLRFHCLVWADDQRRNNRRCCSRKSSP